MAGTPGRSWGTAGTRQAIVHQLQVWRVEGVRPRQVRYGREHPPKMANTQPLAGQGCGAYINSISFTKEFKAGFSVDRSAL